LLKHPKAPIGIFPDGGFSLFEQHYDHISKRLSFQRSLNYLRSIGKNFNLNVFNQLIHHLFTQRPFQHGGRSFLNTTSPFEMLVKKSVSHQKNKAVFLAKNGLSTLWLPGTDSNHAFSVISHGLNRFRLGG